MTAYYNEIDPYAAQWLRNLIDAGHIAPGDVDERSIEDVRPTELVGYTQCHFFAGIGVWSLALRRAGWPDNKKVWTGSCPCQPFSAAGKGDGFADERHLWPHFFHLIEQCRPAAIFGEQVASKDAESWIDLVQTDLEAVGYAFGAVPFPSAGVGAPHIRDRLYWVGYAERAGLEGFSRDGDICSESRRLNSHSPGPTGQASCFSRMAHAQCCECEAGSRGHNRQAETECKNRANADGCRCIDGSAAGATNGFWGNADWLFCRDKKFRPVEPGTFPLAHGSASRVGRLRAYGNAINAAQAQIFIEASGL